MSMDAVALPSLPLHTYPGVFLPLPSASWVRDVKSWDFDLCYAQTTTLLVELGIWLRYAKGIPLLCVNTTHLIAAYDVLLPEKISKIKAVHTILEKLFRRPYEKFFTYLYNQSDGLVVLSEGLRDYWQKLGVRVPIYVIPRTIQADIFDRSIRGNPYLKLLGDKVQGLRLLCVGRHTREKSQDRVIRIFARNILSACPEATLTLVGQGPDTDYYRRVACQLGVQDRVFFTGEVPFTDMLEYYSYGDVFVHASLSETYGNVLGEALWCGMPVVAFEDGMGASSQIKHGVNGILIQPGCSSEEQEQADAVFGKAVLQLASSPEARASMGKTAASMAKEHVSSANIQQRMVDAFMGACQHRARSNMDSARMNSPFYQLWLKWIHFGTWISLSLGLFLLGLLRPSRVDFRKPHLHPSLYR
ncbi:acetyltransferase [Pajaroellobacter abortibovis]|uniref:Acetyltransferase n=2 Tax=Pajaroellobacter abortibovis TaxID=1882918 RepID=A0A1L6MZD0_9BACT|nr:acetyltransferase [Pajaroellobacter abortibovis]